MNPHPYSKSFPMIAGEEYAVFKKDIEENGLHNPIITYQGMILDGRNRFKACTELGIEPKFKEFEGDDVKACQFVLSQNIFHRHLTPGQRAVAALPLYDKIIELKQPTTYKKGVQKTHQQNRESSSVYKVSKTIGVGLNVMGNAIKLRNVAPELLEKVKTGEMTMSKANSIAPKVKNPNAANRVQELEVSKIVADISLSEPFDIPKAFDTYEKFMAFCRQVSHMGYLIQTTWAKGRVHAQIIKANDSFSTWSNTSWQPDFRGSVCWVASMKLSHLKNGKAA